jgi:membrane-bound lytic murein transglycosylase D
MQKYNTNDYWELCRHEDGLPWETLLYVPKAIATALVGENKSFFGYEDLASDPAITFDSVPVRGSVSLATAARVIGSTAEELQRLNPHLRRGRTPPLATGETWELRLPPGSAALFGQSADARGERLEPYTVRFGERLEDVAKLRGTSVSALRRINGIEDSAEIRTGITLLLPPVGPASAKVDAGTSPPLSAEEIVVVAVPDRRLVVPGKKRVFYRVIPGDSIWAIAHFFKVNQAELSRWNNLDPEATLATKMVLDLWVDKDFDTSQVVLVDPSRVRVVTTGSNEFFELVETLRGRKRVQYKCQSGDTLDKIAKRFGLTVADVERINRMGRTTEVQPGQTIIVYQNMSAAERAAAVARLLPGAAAGNSAKGKPGDPEAAKSTPPDEPPGEAGPPEDGRAPAVRASEAAESAPGRPSAGKKSPGSPPAVGPEDAPPPSPPPDREPAALDPSALPLPSPPPTLPAPPPAYTE